MKVEVPESYQVYTPGKKERIRCIAISAAALFVAAYLFYQSVPICILAAALAFRSIPFYAKHQAKKRKEQLHYQFKDALYAISASVSAGRQLPQAFSEGAESMKLLYGEEALIVKELTYVSRRILDLKEAEDEVLFDLARRTGIADIMNFVDVYSTCRAAGGDTEKVLAKTSRMIMDKIAIDREIHVIVAQKKMETKILAVLPAAVILFMQLASAEYISVMYTTATGRIVMTLAALAIAASFMISSRITDIQV